MQSYPYYSHSVVIFREVGFLSTGPLFSRCPGRVRLAITTRSSEDEGQQLLTSASQIRGDVSFFVLSFVLKQLRNTFTNVVYNISILYS